MRMDADTFGARKRVRRRVRVRVLIAFPLAAHLFGCSTLSLALCATDTTRPIVVVAVVVASSSSLHRFTALERSGERYTV